MHPQIVVGAWAGFNDSRVTIKSDQWGQGSRSALPMVGDFMHRALNSPLLNSKASFVEPKSQHWWGDLVERLRDKMQAWSSSSPDEPSPNSPAAHPGKAAPATPASPAAPSRSDSDADITETTPALPSSPASVPAKPESPAAPANVDGSPGLSPSDTAPAPTAARPPTPSSWSDVGTALPPAAPLNAPATSP